MQTNNPLLEAIDWTRVDEERQPGASGHATCKTRQSGSIRIRLIEFTPGYVADAWSTKRQVLYCIAGAVTVEAKDTPEMSIQAGMSLVTEESGPPHRFSTEIGALLYIVD